MAGLKLILPPPHSPPLQSLIPSTTFEEAAAFRARLQQEGQAEIPPAAPPAVPTSPQQQQQPATPAAAAPAASELDGGTVAATLQLMAQGGPIAMLLSALADACIGPLGFNLTSSVVMHLGLPAAMFIWF